MLSALKLFEHNIGESSRLIALFDYADQHFKNMDFSDLLRAHIVYSVSAFDKLIHDFIIIGMIEIFLGKRNPTPKYLAEGISLQIHNKILEATIPPKEYYFEREIRKKLSYLSFVDPSKIADGLSLIWEEKHKWQKIALILNEDQDIIKKKLKTIAIRRNQIVHEADIDISSGKKYPINKYETQDVANFIINCGKAIYQNLKL